jgi:superfamily II DNA or RNA helicase
MAGLTLRDYQVEAVHKSFDAEEDYGHHSAILSAATGTGKSLILAEISRVSLNVKGRPVLLLNHREELVNQNYKTFIEHLGLTPRQIGIEKAEFHADPRVDLLIGSVATVTRKERIAEWLLFHPGPKLLISDECFPAGTMIDGKPIETIRIGDTVNSFCHASGKIERRRVTHVFSRTSKQLVRISFSNGQQLVCTPEHPIFNGKEYVPACSLSAKDRVYCIITHRGGMMHGQKIHQATNLRGMRKRLLTAKLEQYDGSHLFRNMQKYPQRGTAQDTDTSLLSMRETRHVQREKILGAGPKGQGVLLGNVPVRIHTNTFLSNDESNQSQIRFGTHEAQQSYAPARGSGEDESVSTGIGAQAERTGRQWQTYSTSSKDFSRGIICADRVCNPNENETGFGLSHTLQSRHSHSVLTNRYRGRRPFSYVLNTQGTGRKEAGVLRGLGVVRVEVYQSGDTGESDGMSQDCPVYNLEIEGNNNYFAEGVLVHNCHHATAASWRVIADNLGYKEGNCFHIGATATCKRTDNKSLYMRTPDNEGVLIKDRKTRAQFPADAETSVYDILAFDYPILTGIENGWLVDPKGFTGRSAVDLSEIPIQGEGDERDFNRAALAKKLETNKARTNVAISTWLDVAKDRQTIAYCASVLHAQNAASAWRSAGFKAAAIWGNMPDNERYETIKAYRAGDVQILTNYQVLGEGNDFPNCSAIVHLCPTKSWTRYVQTTGRGLRPETGLVDRFPTATLRRRAIACSQKSCAIVIDIVDIHKGKNICTLPAILDMPSTLDMEGASLTEVKKMLDRYDKEKEVVLEEEPTTFQEVKIRLEAIDLLHGAGPQGKENWDITREGYRLKTVPPGYSVHLKSCYGDCWNLFVRYHKKILHNKTKKAGAEFEAYLDSASKKARQVIREHKLMNTPALEERLADKERVCYVGEGKLVSNAAWLLRKNSLFTESDFYAMSDSKLRDELGACRRRYFQAKKNAQEKKEGKGHAATQ